MSSEQGVEDISRRKRDDKNKGEGRSVWGIQALKELKRKRKINS